MYWLIALGLTVGAVWAGDSNTLTFTVLMGGRTAGLETETRSGGATDIRWQYNDRGRGPDITAHYALDATGFPTAVSLTGINYTKAPVSEAFSSSTEHRWYVSAEGPPGELAMLARALLAAKDHSAPLLPWGTATLERGATATVTAGNRKLQVSEYLIGGMGFSAEPIWLDAANEFFASVAPIQSTIRQGWESAAGDLLRSQMADEEQRLHALAARLGHRPPHGLAIRHVRVFDSLAGAMRDDRQVRIEGSRIVSVAPDHDGPPAGAEAIDGRGKTLLPGLFDMHAHFESFEGLLNIACGVTSIRDLGNDMDALLRFKRQFDDDREIGPRIVLAGIMDGRGPYSGPTNVLVDTEDEARAAIDRYAANGYIQIKIYSSVKPELVPAIVRMAHAKGMRVSGHVPAGMIARQFIDAGVDEMQHINFVLLNFMPDVAPQTNTRVRLTAVAERAAGIDLNSAPVKSFIETLARRQIVVDPTLGAFEGMLTARKGTVAPGYAAIVDRLPLEPRREAYTGGLPVPEGKNRLYRDSFEAMLRMVKLLYDAGVPLVIGTDGVEGLMLHRELELWVKAGIPPAKVLQIATIGAARVARCDAELGSVTDGKKADLVMVDGDPSQSISDIRKCSMTIKDGIVYRGADLYRELGMAN